MASSTVIKVGVTGHRILAETDALIQGIDGALNAIQSACAGLQFQVLTALAEGADRIVAARASKLIGAKVVAILPFAPEIYEQDFQSEESLKEFRHWLHRAQTVRVLESSGERNQGYRAAGLAIVRECDVLVALWDGKPEQGVGGTAEFVSEAQRLEKPLIVVRTGNRTPGSESPTTAPDQGRLILEGFHPRSEAG